MMDLIYMVLYTHQKTKKAKTWQDGTLKVLATGTKAVLYDDKGSKLDALHVHASDVVTGEQLESDRYYIQVEELQKKCSAPASDTGVTSARFPQRPHHPAVPQSTLQARVPEARTAQSSAVRNEGPGLKRKRSGFIPPRVVRPRTQENETSSPDVHTAQASASPVYAPYRGPSSRLFSTTPSASSNTPEERMPSADLSLGGRTTMLESAEKPPESARALLSPQCRPQAVVAAKASPWRTIGSALSKPCPPVLGNLSSEQTRQLDGREQSVSRGVSSAWGVDKCDWGSPSSRLSSSESGSVFKPQETSVSLSGNCIQSGLNQPVGKRSASEIMALLGKKRHEAGPLKTADKMSTSENSTVPLQFNKHTEICNQKPLSVESKTCEQTFEFSLGEVDSQDILSTSPVHDRTMLQKSSPKEDHQNANFNTLPTCSETDGEGTSTYSHPQCTSLQNSESDVSPKLSASTLSLSKHDFEMEEDFDDESLSSRSAAAGCVVFSRDDHSQTLSDADFCQADPHTGFGDEKEESFSESFSGWSGTHECDKDMAEVIQEQSSEETNNRSDLNLGPSTDTYSEVQNKENEDLPAERNFQSDRNIEFQSENDQLNGDTQCTESAMDDGDACFELGFSPLSEEGGESDEETVPECDDEKLSCEEALHPMVTVSVEQHVRTATKQHLPAEQQSHMSEKLPEPVDSHGNSKHRYPVDSVKTCQNTDRGNIPEAALMDCPVTRGNSDNASEMRNGDCVSQFSTPGNRLMNSEFSKENINTESDSEAEKVERKQTPQRNQKHVSETLTTGAVRIKSLDTSSCGITDNRADPIRTVNDLNISPDCFRPAESSYQSPAVPVGDDTHVKKLFQSNHEKEGNQEDTQSSCDAYQADEEQHSRRLHRRNNVHRLLSGITVESFQEHAGAVVSELSIPSPALSSVSVSSPDQYPMLNAAMHSSRFDSYVNVQDSPTALFRSTKPVNRLTSMQQTSTQHGHMLYDNNSDDDHWDKDSPTPAPPGLPVLRPFQTVTEVLGGRGAETRQAALLSAYEEDTVAVLREKRAEDKSQASTMVESLTSDSTDMESVGDISQPVSSPLPHPDRLAEGSTNGNCSVAVAAASDIAETISARLTDYKMQGALASDMVQRSMAYRPDTVYRPDMGDHRPSLPFISSAAPEFRHSPPYAGSKGILGFSSGSLSPNIRKTADQNSSATGKTSFQMQTSGSVRTPESQLFSPAGEDVEANESSLFIHWDGGKPCFIKPTRNEQIKRLHEDTQQVPVFTDGVSMLQMSSQYQTGGSYRAGAQSSLHPHTPDSSCSHVFDSQHRLGQQNPLQPYVPRPCQVDGVKGDRCVNSNNKEENGGAFVDDDLQSVPSLCMEEKRGKMASDEPSFACSSSGVEASTVSPVLFSQCVQSQAQVASFNRSQRQRKLKPVVTAPDELAYGESLSLQKEKAVENTSLKGVGCTNAILSKHDTPVKIQGPFPLQTNSTESPAVLEDRHSSTDCHEQNLWHSHVDNLDFSEFADSFPETDHYEGQELHADSVTSLDKHISHAESKSNIKNAGSEKQKHKDVRADCAAHLEFNSESTYRIGGQKVKQCNSTEDQRSYSVTSSPKFVIANSGLDCGEDLEDDSPVMEDDENQPQRFLGGQKRSSVDSVQRQNKVTKFASQFQTSHPHAGKENQSRMNKGKTIHPYGSDSGYVATSLNKGRCLGPEVLAPSSPTDSPPLDFSPERDVENGTDTGRHHRQHATSQQTPSSAWCSPYIQSQQLNGRYDASHTGTESSTVGQRGFQGSSRPKPGAGAQYKAPSPAVGTSGVSGRSPAVEGQVTRTPAMSNSRTVGLGKFRKPGVSTVSGCLPGSQFPGESVVNQFQSSLCHELQFCSREEVERQATPLRQVAIPPSFQSFVSYKQILTAALTEFVNIQLFTVAKTYHCALSKVDLTAYTEGVGAVRNLAGVSTNPACRCGSASKVAQVKKEGPNKGRFFYACSAPRDKQCKFFQWVDQQTGGSSSRGGGKGSGTTMVRPKFTDPASIMGYFRSQGLAVHCQCQFVRRVDNRGFTFGFPKWVRPQQSDSVQKKSLFLKLPSKDSMTTYARDDLWVISKSLSFAKGEMFVARSTFHGPNTHGEVAVEPLTGYAGSLWTDGSVCHAIHCGNASTELACMTNIQDHVNMTSLPLLPHLLSQQPCSVASNRMASKGFKAPTTTQGTGKLHIPPHFVHELAEEFISKYQLNKDQAQAVRGVASMMDKEADPAPSLMLIHGVFGAGKSFLLSVVILFLVEVFQRNDTYCPGVPFPWKLLLSSTTNVAVDRVLQGLLELGFDDFVRVGSVKKIAKPVLPYSMHASGSDNQELKDLQEMLKSTDITAAEKHCIRKSIERHRLGENRKRLGAVRVVGVTCAACSFQCLDKMLFPFVMLDECSQMTEPSSLLPIARSACEKLLLVGDPKQLDPTLQGSEAAHTEGLEQTLFDRLMKMGHAPVILRTQYRCHPTLSAVSNTLFYQGQLEDGVAPHQRQPILDLFPTMCFYDLSTGEERTDATGSFTNEAEAQFVALLLSVLMVRGIQPTSVGVITLYRAQARCILNIIRQTKGDAERQMTGVQVSTVDAFQGAERDIIILSCVRTRSVGFIDSDKRMNVALTRARHHMLIVGHQRNLYGNKRWAEVIGHCQALAGGVVAAAIAGRQLQAELDQASEDQDTVAAVHASPQCPDEPQQTAVRKRKSTSKKDAADSQTGHVSLPPVTKAFISAHPEEPTDIIQPSSNQMENRPTENVERDEETVMIDSSGGSSCEVKCNRPKKARTRVKPLVIDDDEEEEKAPGDSSDDDFLPEGLF